MHGSESYLSFSPPTQIQLLKRAVSKFRGQVTIDGKDVNEADGDHEQQRSQSIQLRGNSIGGGSPLYDRVGPRSNIGRRKVLGQKNVTIKTAASTVPTPNFQRNDAVASVQLHVGGSAWTRESMAYAESAGSTRPNSRHSSRNVQVHGKSADQSPVLSPPPSMYQIPSEISKRPTTADSLAYSAVMQTKTASDYVQGTTTAASVSYIQDSSSSSIKFVEERPKPNSDNTDNVDMVQAAFDEYKSDMARSLSQLDSKINRLESMISILVERIPSKNTAMNTTSNNDSAPVMK